jgi:hypothetical protein
LKHRVSWFESRSPHLYRNALVVQWQNTAMPRPRLGSDSRSAQVLFQQRFGSGNSVAECRSSKPVTWVRFPPIASNASVAQWSEHRTRNAAVAGSTPACGCSRSYARVAQPAEHAHGKGEAVGSKPTSCLGMTNGSVAQRPEQGSHKPKIVGSNPTASHRDSGIV